MSGTFHRIADAVQVAALWFLLGFLTGHSLAPAPRLEPLPAPAPQRDPLEKPRPAPVHHTGHFTVSYLEPRYGSPASAAIRDQLAGADWKPLDCTFRSYTDGQAELKTLGFTPHFTSADLPLVFIQETGPQGAPIIDTIRSPATAAAVLTRIQELRGR